MKNTIENTAAKAQGGHFVFLEYLSNAGVLLAVTIQLVVDYATRLSACLRSLQALDRQALKNELDGKPCFQPISKKGLTNMLRSMGLSNLIVEKKPSAAYLVYLLEANSRFRFTVRNKRAYLNTYVTPEDFNAAWVEIKESLRDDHTRKANHTQVDTYEALYIDPCGNVGILDDNNAKQERLRGLKRHTIKGHNLIQGLVTRSQVVKGYDGSPVANTDGKGIEAGTPKAKPLSSGVAVVKAVIRERIGWSTWKTYRADRCVYISSGGHKLGHRYIENPFSNNNPTEWSGNNA
jgi:hypothetical protein